MTSPIRPKLPQEIEDALREYVNAVEESVSWSTTETWANRCGAGDALEDAILAALAKARGARKTKPR